jgi:hypothetical protein
MARDSAYILLRFYHNFSLDHIVISSSTGVNAPRDEYILFSLSA